MKVINEVGLPIKMWLDDLEESALAQARNLARLPFARKWVCLMPDAHMGHGMPIGGVLATRGVVVPNAVGVDIGCGMCFQATNIPIGVLDKDTGTVGKLVNGIIGNIKRNVPVGFASHQTKQECLAMESSVNIGSIYESSLTTADGKENGLAIIENAYHQVGTLGGGNHFIELQSDEEGRLCIMLHSGSRNMGKKVCDFYNRAANTFNEMWFSSVDPKWELGFLPMDSDLGREYLAWMDLSLSFAAENRQRMMCECVSVILNMVKKYDGFTGIELNDQVNIHHNYAAMEHHYGENLLVHRKGAAKATDKTIGIIPGSMGTNSYIVQGLGNPESFMSCSHGAGRRMGRKQATRTLDLKVEQLRMAGILHGMTKVEDLDEAPGAYKDIDVVMQNQTDLVRPIKKLRPLAVIKG